MSAWRELAPGKINLCLFLGPMRKADGRHELVSVVQSVTLADILTLAPAGSGAKADEVQCEGVEGENLAARALAAFREATGWDAPPQRIDIAKRVPVAGGMGGGSGDAAATLRLAHRASGLGDDEQLLRIAPGLGSDVPAQMRPGRALTTAAGEEVRALAPGPPVGILVLPGPRPLSTARVYAEADRLGLPREPADLTARLAAVRAAIAKDGELGEELLVNDLQPAARSLEPTIDEALATVREAGADHAMVSGSGPTTLGLFFGSEGSQRALSAASRLVGTGAIAAGPVTEWPLPEPEALPPPRPRGLLS